MSEVIEFAKILSRVAQAYAGECFVTTHDLDAAIKEFETRGREHALDDKRMPPAKDSHPAPSTPWTICVWEGCDQDAIYCEGHAHEFTKGRFCLAHSKPDEHGCPCCAAVEERRLRDAAEATLAKLKEPLMESERRRLSAALWEDTTHDAVIREFLRLRGVGS